MAGNSKELEILLKLKAETAEATSRVTGAIQEIKSQGGQAEEAMNRVGRGGRAAGAELGRSLAAGRVDAQALVSTVGSLSPAFAMVGVAAYGVYNLIVGASDASLAFNRSIRDQATELNKSVNEWAALAQSVESTGDELQLADKISRDIDRAQTEFLAFRNREETAWISWSKKIADVLSRTFLSAIPGHGASPFAEEAGRQQAAAQMQLNATVRAGNIEMDVARERHAEWDKALVNPSSGLAVFSEKLTAARARLQELDNQRRASPTDATRLEAAREQLRLVADLEGKEKQLTNALEKGNIQHHTATRATKETGSAQRDITALTREQANLLSRIRDEQSAIASNPFMSIDQKDKAMVPLITQQITALNAMIEKDKQALRGSALDPAQYQQVAASIRRAQGQVRQLGQTLKTLSFGGSIRADLTAWVNQFGSTAKQVTGIITGTLNTAIASTSQALTGLIFKTTSWKEAFGQAAMSIVQNIIEILLQIVVSKALSSAMTALHVGEQTAAGAAIATANAPAAAATSIATSGGSAVAGGASAAAAIAAIIGAIVGGGGGFRRGGFTGVATSDSQVAGVVHANEYVIPARIVRERGVPFFDHITTNVSRPTSGYQIGGFVGASPAFDDFKTNVSRSTGGYQSGGFVGASPATTGGGGSGGDKAMQIKNLILFDKKQLQRELFNSRGARVFVMDVVNGRSVDLGIRR